MKPGGSASRGGTFGLKGGGDQNARRSRGDTLSTAAANSRGYSAKNNLAMRVCVRGGCPNNPRYP